MYRILCFCIWAGVTELVLGWFKQAAAERVLYAYLATPKWTERLFSFQVEQRGNVQAKGIVLRTGRGLNRRFMINTEAFMFYLLLICSCSYTVNRNGESCWPCRSFGVC